MSQYKTGTASVTNGSATVTGSGTLWLANVSAGDSFTIAGTGVLYDVASVSSDTSLSLSTPYTGVSATEVVYTIARDFTSPDNFPELSVGDIETPVILTRAIRKIQQRFNLAGDAALIAAAGIYPNVSQGLSSTVEGEYFFVTGGEDLILYINTAGAAVEQYRYASFAAITDYASQASDSANSANTSATDAAQSAIQSGVFRDQASEISGLATVEDAIATALPQAPALLDGLRRSVEAASGGNMTVFYTANGLPSYFTRIPQFLCEDVVKASCTPVPISPPLTTSSQRNWGILVKYDGSPLAV